MARRHGIVTCMALALLAVDALPQRQDEGRRRRPRTRENAPVVQDFNLFVTGDVVLTRRWSRHESGAFDAVMDEARSADAAIVNLETTLHDFRGVYPERYDGQGPPRAADPAIAAELQWAGVDVVCAAHDHTYDYGALGVLSTLRHVEGKGLVVAGAGRDLQTARGPAYYYGAKGFVGVVAASASYSRWGVATEARPELHGKPGLNPLSVRWTMDRTITAAVADKIADIAREESFDFEVQGSGEGRRILGATFTVGDRNEIIYRGKVSDRDLEANLAAVSKARNDASVVVFALHAHRPGAWIEDIAHRVLDGGADVFVAHGPAGIRGIEIYNGKPAFYGLGSFAFQADTISRLPAEYLEAVGLSADTPASEAMRRVAAPWAEAPERWRSLAAVVQFRSGELARVRVLPLDLHAERGFGVRGTPEWAGAEQARTIIEELRRASARYGTQIDYDADDRAGTITLR